MGVVEANTQRFDAIKEEPSFYNIGNYLTSGSFDVVRGTFAPEEPLSFDHWMCSLGTATMLLPAMKGVSNAFPVKSLPLRNPLVGIKYTNKVVVDFGKGDFHSFPIMVDNYGALGIQSTVFSYKGIPNTKLQIPGYYHGYNGFFEYIYDSNGICNHRFFVKGR